MYTCDEDMKVRVAREAIGIIGRKGLVGLTEDQNAIQATCNLYTGQEGSQQRDLLINFTTDPLDVIVTFVIRGNFYKITKILGRVGEGGVDEDAIEIFSDTFHEFLPRCAGNDPVLSLISKRS